MERTVLKFDDFLNEEVNFTRIDGMCKLEDRWFYYEPDDEIIYGCDDKPVGDAKLFAFNPSSCTILIGNDEKQYDINNPLCLIGYNMDTEEVKVYTENALEYLNEIGYPGSSLDVNSQACRASLMDFFENKEDVFKFILIYGDKLVASSFDVIEEN